MTMVGNMETENELSNFKDNFPLTCIVKEGFAVLKSRDDLSILEKQFSCYDFKRHIIDS